MIGKRAWRPALAAAIWLALSAPLPAADGVSAVDAARLSIASIDAAELARLRDQGATIIDVRRADEWRATGVIPDSLLITAFDADGRLLPGFTAEVDAAVGKGRPLALICRSGNRSASAARLLMADGGDRTLYNVAGGIGAWSAAGGPLVPCPTC